MYRLTRPRSRSSLYISDIRLFSSRALSAAWSLSSNDSPPSHELTKNTPPAIHRTYTVGQKSKPAYFCNNFVYCWPAYRQPVNRIHHRDILWVSLFTDHGPRTRTTDLRTIGHGIGPNPWLTLTLTLTLTLALILTLFTNHGPWSLVHGPWS